MGHGEAQLSLIEVGGPGGLGGELYHLLPAGLVDAAAFAVFAVFAVFAGQNAGILVAEGAGCRRLISGCWRGA